MSRNIKLLEKRNIVDRTSDYRPQIELTTKGEALVDTIIPVWENLMDDLMSKLGSDGITPIASLEEKLK